MNETHNLSDYMALHYPIILIPDENGTWFAEIPDLPGCMTYAETAAAALVAIEDAKHTWLAMHLRHNDPIPPPSQPTNVPEIWRQAVLAAGA